MLDLLAAALDLVNGSAGAETPTGSFDWLVEEPGTYRCIESVLVDAACRLGEIALAAGDVERELSGLPDLVSYSCPGTRGSTAPASESRRPVGT